MKLINTFFTNLVIFILIAFAAIALFVYTIANIISETSNISQKYLFGLKTKFFDKKFILDEETNTIDV